MCPLPLPTNRRPRPFDFATASKNVPKPRAVWPIVKQDMVAPEFTVLSNELVTSDTDPSQKLRKITAHFWSQELAGKKWGHRCVIFLPEDNSRNLTPERMGKVVIVGSPPYAYFPIHVDKYAEPIAARTGYPTMALSNPGEYPDGSAVEHDMIALTKLRKGTGKNHYSMNCQLAVVYIQAMNVLQKYLGLNDLKAVIGGHSKRGTQRHGGRRDGLARCVGHHHGKRGRLPHGSRPVASLVPSCVLSGSGQRSGLLPLVQQTKTATRCST